MIISRETFGSQPDRIYEFKPQENISAYEVAQLLPFLLASWKSVDMYQQKRGEIRYREGQTDEIENLDENLRRHFRRIDQRR